MPHTLQNQRFWAVGMLKSGMSATVKQFGVSWQTASLWLHCCQMTRNVSDLPCSGSPRMLHHCLWSKFQPEQLALSLDWEECVLILSRTIWVSKVYTQDVLLIVQLSSLVTMLCNLPRHHLYLRNAQWYRVAFTDECSINFLGADGCHRVYRWQLEHHASKSMFVMAVEGLWSGEASAPITGQTSLPRGYCHWLAILGWDSEEPHRAVCAKPCVGEWVGEWGKQVGSMNEVTSQQLL